MMTFKTGTFTVFDFESTGPDTEEDRIVEFNFKRYEDGVLVQEMTELVNPGIPIPAGASEVHGITDDDVKDAGPLNDWIETILSLMYGAVLVGYNILNFDLPLLENEMRRIGYPSSLIELLTQEAEVRVIDVFSMYKELRPWTLEAAYRELVDPDHEQTHRAEDDVRMTGELLDAMMTEKLFETSSIEDLNGLSFGDRIDWTGRFKIANGVVVVGFGKHRDKPLREAYKVDRSWFAWASGKIPGFQSAFELACKRQRELETSTD